MNVVVLSCSEAMIPFLLMPFPDNKNVLFHPIAQVNLTLFAHIMYHDTEKILVKDTTEQPLCILHCQKPGHIVDICYDNCFLADAECIFNLITVSLQTAPFFEHKISCTLTPTDLSIETKLDNKIKIYGDIHAVELLAQLVAEYSSNWESKGFV